MKECEWSENPEECPIHKVVTLRKKGVPFKEAVEQVREQYKKRD